MRVRSYFRRFRTKEPFAGVAVDLGPRPYLHRSPMVARGGSANLPSKMTSSLWKRRALYSKYS